MVSPAFSVAVPIIFNLQLKHLSTLHSFEKYFFLNKLFLNNRVPKNIKKNAKKTGIEAEIFKSDRDPNNPCRLFTFLIKKLYVFNLKYAD